MSADQSCFWGVEKNIEDEEIDENSEEEEKIEVIQSHQTEISLCAFEGHINSNTIRLDEFIKCQCISVLVNTGSTHNFMQVEVANALKLVIHVIEPFIVSTGSGEKHICDRVCKNVEIKIQDTTVKMDIFLLPMVGSNMVIGIQGLKALGPVTFDFVKLWMKFERNKQVIIWHGCPWISEDPLSSAQLNCLIASTQEAYLCYMKKVEDVSDVPILNSSNQEVTEIIQEY